MKKFTVKNDRMFVNGDRVPIAGSTVRVALWSDARRNGWTLPGPEEREIAPELATRILAAARALAVQRLEEEWDQKS